MASISSLYFSTDWNSLDLNGLITPDTTIQRNDKNFHVLLGPVNTMRILPRSLFGRLVLVMLTGLILTQLLSAFILLRDRGKILYQSMRDDLITRTVGIVRLLESFPVRERCRCCRCCPAGRCRLRYRTSRSRR